MRKMKGCYCDIGGALMEITLVSVGRKVDIGAADELITRRLAKFVDTAALTRSRISFRGHILSGFDRTIEYNRIFVNTSSLNRIICLSV